MFEITVAAQLLICTTFPQLSDKCYYQIKDTPFSKKIKNNSATIYTMQNNKILLAIGAVILTFIGLFAVYKLLNVPIATNFPEINKIKADDHVKWSTEKKNILVEYSDYQCPFCRYTHELISQTEASNSAYYDVTKRVTFVYRHYPLTMIHPSSIDASYTAEAAAKQGKFNEMSDLLFKGQEEWGKSNNPKDIFIKYAQSLKLNIDQFKKDADSNEVKARVQADLDAGQKAGIDSTPTFFLNGNKVERIQSMDDLKKFLQSL